MILFLAARTFAAPEVTICICPGVECGGNCPSDNVLDPVDKFWSRDFYNDLRNMMGRAMDVHVYFIDPTGKSDQNTYEPTIALGAFSDRNVVFSSISAKTAPKAVIFNYLDKHYLQNTAIIFNNLTVIIINCNTPSKSTTISVRKFIYSVWYDSTYTFTIFPNDSTEYHLITEVFSGNFAKLGIFKSIEVTSYEEAISLAFFSAIDINIEILDDYLIGSFNSRQLYLKFNNKCSLEFIGHDSSESLTLKFSSYHHVPYFPGIKIMDIQNIIIEGSANYEKNKLLITGTMAKISFKSSLFPFDVKLDEAHFYLETNVNFPGVIIAKDTYFYGLDEEKSKYDIFINHSEGKICSRDSRFSFIISTLVFESDANNLKFPYELAINKNSVTKIKVENYIGPKKGNSIQIGIFCSIKTITSDEELIEFLDDSLEIITISGFDLSKFDLFYPYFTSDSISINIHGFTNETNCIKLSSENETILLTMSRPSEIPVSLCYGEKCISSYGISLTDAEISNIGQSELFVNYATRCEIYIATTKNKSLTIDFTSYNGNITNILMRNIINGKDTSPEIGILFPQSAMFTQFTVDNLKLSTNITFYSQRVNMLRIYFDDNINSSFPNFDYCEELETDVTSMPYVLFTDHINNFVINFDNSYKSKIVIIAEDLIKFVFTSFDTNDVSKRIINTTLYDNLTVNSYGFTFKCKLSHKVESIKGFNVQIIALSEIVFKGDWNMIEEIKNKLVISRGRNLLFIVYTDGFLHEDIIFAPGHGAIYFTTSYDTAESICIYNNITDKDACSTQSKKCTIDEYENITEFNSQMYTITLSGFDSAEERAFIDMKYFYNKEVTIKPAIRLKVQYLEVSLINNPKYISSFTFRSLHITTTTSGTVFIGGLDLTSCVLEDGFKQIDLVTARLSCRYSNLVEFKSVNVTDTLSINGEISNIQTEFSANFLGIINGNSITLTIRDTCDFVIYKDAFKIGTITIKIFKFSSDMLFLDFSSKTNITFSCGDQDIKEFTTIKVYWAEHGGQIYFVGSWPQIELFSFIDPSDLDIYIEYTVPLYIVFPSNVRIYSIGKETGINGEILLAESNSVSIYSNMDGSTMTLKNVYYLNDYQEGISIFIKSPTLTLIIENIDASSYLVTFCFCNSFDEHGSSHVIVHNCLSSFRYDNKIKVISLINGPLKNESSYTILSQNIPLLTLPAGALISSTTEMSIVYVDQLNNATHGFGRYWNCLGLVKEVSNNIAVLYMKPIAKPKDMPYYIQLTNSKAYAFIEKQITDPSLLQQLDEVVPLGIRSIYIFLSMDVPQDVIIDLSKLQDNYHDLNITFDGQKHGGRIVSIKLGSRISILGLLSIQLSNSNLEIKNLEVLNLSDTVFTPNSIIIDPSVKKIIADVDSYISLSESGCIGDMLNNVTIRRSNIITFRENGWRIQEDVFKKSINISHMNFSTLVLDTSTDVQLLLDNPDQMTSIDGVNISVHPPFEFGNDCMVTFGDGWNKVKVVNDLLIKPIDIDNKTGYLSFATITYPIPKVYSTEYKIKISFEGRGKDLVFQLPDDINLTDYIVFNLSNAPKDSRVLWGKNIYVSNVAYIETCEAVLKCNQLVFEQSSLAMVMNTVVLEKIIFKIEALAFLLVPEISSTSEFDIYWNVEKGFPLISLNIMNGGKPKSINMILDDDNPDFAKYNNYLYREKFNIFNNIDIQENECSQWKDTVTFISSCKYFNQSKDLILEVFCDDYFKLSIRGIAYIPIVYNITNDSVKEDKTISDTVIAGITISCVILACIAVGIGVYLFTRKKYEKSSDSIRVASIRKKEVEEIPRIEDL